MNPLRITVITVCFNSARTIRETLASVASQAYDNLEHIIIDGSSRDGTVEIVRSWDGHPVRFLSEPDRGIFDAMNKGLRLATGDVVGFLNSDDVYYDAGVLKKVAETMSDARVDACYADLIYVEKNNLDKIVRFWKSCPFTPGLFGTGWVPPHPTFFARRRIFDRFGLFDLNYSLAADYELMARFLEKSQVHAVYIPQILVKMRYGGASNKNLSNIIKQNLEIYRALKKNNISFCALKFFSAKLISRIRQYASKPSLELI